METSDPSLAGSYPLLEPTVFSSAMQSWQQGQQEPAKAQIRPVADAGNPVAAALLAWFLHQQGDPGWREAVSYAEVAVRGGYPQAAGFVIGNMMNDPGLRSKAVEMARMAAPFGLQYLDPFSQAIQYAQQNDVAGVEAMLGFPWPIFPVEASQWSRVVQVAHDSSSKVEQIRRRAEERESEVSAASDSALAKFNETRAAIEAQSARLKTLITQTTNAQASSFFDSEAKSAEGQANKSWNVGVGIVTFAAFLSLLPLIAHYAQTIFHHGVELSRSQLLGAHVTAALALAAVSGVLLTRSRVRDRNRQRNRDLSVALNTMFAYGEQIEDSGERQKFIHDMGRTVIEAYLRQDSATSDDGLQSILGALASR